MTDATTPKNPAATQEEIAEIAEEEEKAGVVDQQSAASTGADKADTADRP